MSLAALVLPGCASEVAQEMRVLIKLAQPTDDARAIAEHASRSSGKPARYLAAAGGAWHAVALACAGPADCDAALARLQIDGANFDAAQRDERKHALSN